MAMPRPPDYQTPYYGGFTDAQLQVWRAIRDAGGYWTPAELSACPEFSAFSAQQMARVLEHLAEYGHLVRQRSRPNKPWLYGFTAACHAPAGQSRRLGEPPEFARDPQQPPANDARWPNTPEALHGAA